MLYYAVSYLVNEGECKVSEKTAAQRHEWEEQVRQGGLQALAHFRRLLLSGKELSADDRQGLLDLLEHTENHMVLVWDTLMPQQVTRPSLVRALLKRRV